MVDRSGDSGPAPAQAAAAAHRRARRDRHGRGMRGAIAPPDVPIAEPRAEQFNRLVSEALEDLAPQSRGRIPDLDVTVREVPAAPDEVVLAEVVAGPRGPLLVVYRRPIEARAQDALDAADLVFDAVVEALADHLGVDPDELDPPTGAG